MRHMLFSSSLAAGVFACAALAGAQGSTSQSSQTITVAGCVQKETAVLKHNALSSNIGLGDEFVLTRAMLNPRDTADAPPRTLPDANVSEPTGTTGSTPIFGKVYRMTGDKEKDLKTYIGRRVEIVGTFKHDEDARRELGPIGTSGVAQDPTVELTAANTPEITITSIRPIAGTCSGATK